jgi:hypothetical protein
MPSTAGHGSSSASFAAGRTERPRAAPGRGSRAWFWWVGAFRPFEVVRGLMTEPRGRTRQRFVLVVVQHCQLWLVPRALDSRTQPHAPRNAAVVSQRLRT